MDGEDRRRDQLLLMHVDRQQPGLPVVAVHQIELVADGRAVRQHPRQRLVEQTETDRIVRPLLALVIEVGVAVPLGEQRMVDQPQPHLRVRQPRLANQGIAAKGRDIGDHPRLELLQHAGIARQGDDHLHAQILQRQRQKPRHIGEAAGLDQGIGFARGEENPQLPAHASSLRIRPPSGGRVMLRECGRFIHGFGSDTR